MMSVGLYTSSRAFRTPMTKDYLMNNSIFDINTLISEFSPPSSIVADFEILCQNLEKMFARQPTDIDVFTSGLVRIMEWSKVRTPAENNSASVGWTARYVGLPELGGTLICQNTEQELMLSLDSSSMVYLGSWRSLRSGEEDQGGIFSIEDSSSGRVLVLDTGLVKKNFQLPDSEGLTWGVAGFLQGIQGDEPPQPEPPKSQSAPVSPVPLPQPNLTDAKLSTEDTPTILASSARQQNKSMSPLSEISDKKPALSDQPAISKPDVWQCVCGNKNAGPVCLKCGKEKPASPAVEKSVPAQPTVCRHCGGVLSIGARFCRICGQEST